MSEEKKLGKFTTPDGETYGLGHDLMSDTYGVYKWNEENQQWACLESYLSYETAKSFFELKIK